MKEYTLNVAGYRIRFGSMIGGPEIGRASCRERV